MVGGTLRETDLNESSPVFYFFSPLQLQVSLFFFSFSSSSFFFFKLLNVFLNPFSLMLDFIFTLC